MARPLARGRRGAPRRRSGRRSTSIAPRRPPLAGDLRGAELVAAEEAYLGSQVGSLTRLLAAKDEYTRGSHAPRRPARGRGGEELGIPAGRLHELAIGGLLHDIGKLSVPDEMLRSGSARRRGVPARQASPARGEALLRELGFRAGVRRRVRDHHERLDGSGYPHGVDRSDLSLETRILTVCDVYDALCSRRVYREAWTHERALALLREEIEDGVRPALRRSARASRHAAAARRALRDRGLAPSVRNAAWTGTRRSPSLRAPTAAARQERDPGARARGRGGVRARRGRDGRRAAAAVLDDVPRTPTGRPRISRSRRAAGRGGGGRPRDADREPEKETYHAFIDRTGPQTARRERSQARQARRPDDEHGAHPHPAGGREHAAKRYVPALETIRGAMRERGELSEP